MGGWKQKSGWIRIPPASCVLFTFPFLSQLSVCLIVSRVRAYLTTDQHREGKIMWAEMILNFHVNASSRYHVDRNGI